MATERKLIQYLPEFMQEYFEMRQIMSAEQPQVDNLWSAADNAFADQFILDATEYGVSRWEAMLQIHPKDTETLDERKFKILTLLNQELPYTMRGLERSLTKLCGATGYSIVLNENEYHIEIRLVSTNKNNYEAVKEMVQKMIPANMTQLVRVMYNSHDFLSQFTHRQLAEFTYEQVRSELFTDGRYKSYDSLQNSTHRDLSANTHNQIRTEGAING